MREATYAEALREALACEMRRDPAVFLLGEDIGVHGGAFGVTRGLIDEFGPDRVINTPISESSFVGAAVGRNFDDCPRPIAADRAWAQLVQPQAVRVVRDDGGPVLDEVIEGRRVLPSKPTGRRVVAGQNLVASSQVHRRAVAEPCRQLILIVRNGLQVRVQTQK